MENLNPFSDLKSKIVVITGGYGYLGSAMANILLEYGAIVYILARTKSKFDLEFSNQLSAFFVKTDVESIKSIDNSIQEIGDKEGRIDVLICSLVTNWLATSNPIVPIVSRALRCHDLPH